MRSQDRGRDGISRRRFLEVAGTACGMTALSGCATSVRSSTSATMVPAGPRVRVANPARGFDPWIDIDGSALRHNVKEVSRLAGGRPILAVVKNNAYGLGDTTVGPIVAECDEVAAVACVRVEEALAMRTAGVTKPILNMAEVGEEETAELARHDVMSSLWLDDAPERMDRIAGRLGRPVPVQLFIDSGMGREGMPDHRARPWMDALCNRPSVRVHGTYTMFAHDLDFDREQLARFNSLVAAARADGLELGTLHAAPTIEVFAYPESHLDMVRPGNAILGNYPGTDGARQQASLEPVYRVSARVVRLERLRPGDGASFYRRYIAERPTWIALLPIGHTDGYPREAANTCQVLIRGRLYPVVSVVSSAHTIVEIGDEKTIDVGDTATLIGPDHPEIYPHVVAEKTERSPLTLTSKLNQRLPRVVV